MGNKNSCIGNISNEDSAFSDSSVTVLSLTKSIENKKFPQPAKHKKEARKKSAKKKQRKQKRNKENLNLSKQDEKTLGKFYNNIDKHIQFKNNLHKKPVYPFIKNQVIKEIRSSNSEFMDKYFPPVISTQVFGPPTSEFVKNLLQTNHIYAQHTESLSSKLKFERTKVISYHKGKRQEFVLNSEGLPLKDFSHLKDDYFSCKDVFQGQIGSCFFLALVLGLTRNLEITSHVMPLDNALHKNVSKGAFHFRFWELGSWYDLVIDDYLLVDYNHNVVLTRNLVCPNEYWMGLLEKAFAKYFFIYVMCIENSQ